ncbi:hypothetical protein QCA50_015588 [Cerrena zonata]|uniref:Uncharacterized protein n=1 Tax=Cerrena zonata TaxID=2478898 RepID=A0AAW0FVX8_9APHY
MAWTVGNQTSERDRSYLRLPTELLHQIVLEVLLDYFHELYTVRERDPSAVIHSDGSIWTSRLSISPIRPMLETSRQFRDITIIWLGKLVGESGLPSPTSQKSLWCHISPILAHLNFIALGIPPRPLKNSDSGKYYDVDIGRYSYDEVSLPFEIYVAVVDSGADEPQGANEDEGTDEDEDVEIEIGPFQEGDDSVVFADFEYDLYPGLPSPYYYLEGIIRYTATSPLHRYYTYRARTFRLIRELSLSFLEDTMAECIEMLSNDILLEGSLVIGEQSLYFENRLRKQWGQTIWNALQACYILLSRDSIIAAVQDIKRRNLGPEERELHLGKICKQLESYHPYVLEQSQPTIRNVIRERFGDFVTLDEDTAFKMFRYAAVDWVLKSISQLSQYLSAEQFARCETLARRVYYYWSIQGPRVAKRLLAIHKDFPDEDEQSSDDNYDDSDSDDETNDKSEGVRAAIISFTHYR